MSWDHQQVLAMNKHSKFFSTIIKSGKKYYYILQNISCQKPVEKIIAATKITIILAKINYTSYNK